MSEIVAEYRAGDRFRLRIRGHQLVADQPRDAGGDDTGPTPTELFVAGLTGCIGFYAERYLRRHRLPTDGLAVDCSYSMSSDRPARVEAIEVLVEIPEGLPEVRIDALKRVIDRCTVHNSLRQPPTVRIEVRQRGLTEAGIPEGVGARR
jgi:putative redox protein